ncbi:MULTISPECIES: dienelactone hydrolase family protein [Arenibacter]|uniref:dienelactone hydrolase family protein n=1 Tax=Arenibacter TaxID=178469 RepID=UPI001C07342C|nr:MULTISPECIES: dienelactone hydrolase family protein [Arenibacter]MBU2905151.1 dienelactone hydrolase family protein [Arenibacter algicola]MCK0132953.1 dienelactone hydrolase family protein [Arenibacter sp. S6351L]
MLEKEKNNAIAIPLNQLTLKANLYIPENAKGLVIFSHGSGSSRLSPRNNFIANILNQQGLATLLLDLLTESEDENYETRFNIDLLTQRLIAATKWVQLQKETKSLSLGYFGASTGAASAIGAAAFFKDDIKAIVSRGGRPDLALDEIPEVTASTLFIVGGKDSAVLELNIKAYAKVECEKKFETIPGASHLFEEPGKLEKVAELSATWFKKWLITKKPIKNV